MKEKVRTFIDRYGSENPEDYHYDLYLTYIYYFEKEQLDPQDFNILVQEIKHEKV